MIEAAELTKVNRDELLARMASMFARREPRLQAGKYVDGLLSDLPRKNGWTLAEHAGDATGPHPAAARPRGVGRTCGDGRGA